MPEKSTRTLEQQTMELKKAARDKLALVVLDEYVLFSTMLHFFIVSVLSIVASGTQITRHLLTASMKKQRPSF